MENPKRVEKAIDYLDDIVSKLESTHDMDVVFKSRDTINSIFFLGDQLQADFIEAIPCEKLNDTCNFLSNVKNLISLSNSDLLFYTNSFRAISNMLKSALVEEKTTIPTNSKKLHKRKKYDVFISHASHDKLDYVDDLKNSIKKLGIEIFYDTDVLSWGDNWKNKILDGTNESEFAIIVISENFFDREWTEKELKEFMNRQNESGQKIILPLLYKISIEKMAEKYPALGEIQTLSSCDKSNNDIAILLAKELIKRYK